MLLETLSFTKRSNLARLVLSEQTREVESEIAALPANHDPLALHIFTSRRGAFQIANDRKSGKRREMAAARVSYNRACELGFHMRLDEMGAANGKRPARGEQW